VNGGGRPLGEIAARVLEALPTTLRPYRAGEAEVLGVTAIDLMRDLQLSRRDASMALYSLRRAQRVVEVARVVQPPARKPVVVCAPAQQAKPAPAIVWLDWPPRKY
jgi:hypothetical protein